jgi:hypothetical protein
MNARHKSILIVLLLVAVAVVFFAPSVDLAPTALRAAQAAQALQVALISAVFVCSGLLCLVGLVSPRDFESLLFIDCDLVTLNCTRLC